MEKDYNEFDELMREKLGEKEFPFNESNWTKMSAMLDASRPSSKSIPVFFIVGSVLVSALLVYLGVWLYSGKSILDKNDLVESSQQGGSFNDNSEAQVSVELSENSVSGINDNNQGKDKNRLSESAKPSSVFLLNKPIAKQNSTEKKERIRQNRHSSKGFSNYSENNSEKTDVYQKNQTNTGMMSENGFSNAQQAQNETENNSLLTNIQNDFVLNESMKQESPINNTDNSENIQPAQPDTSSVAQIKDRDYVKLLRHLITAEAGVNNSLGWQVNGKRNGNSLIPIAGINYQFNFTHKSAVLVGMQYNGLSNITESNVSYSLTTYGFDSKSDITTYKITELQYMVVPVKYMHRVGKMGTVGLGTNFTALVGTKNKIEQYKLEDDNLVMVNSYRDRGYGYDVTRRYNAQLAISYSHKLSKYLGMNVELNRNLWNVFTDYSAFSLKHVSNKPTSIKVSLTYQLFNK